MDLFTHAAAHRPARRTDPATSHAAAASINVTHLESVVLQALLVHGPMTTHEIAQRTGHQLVTVSPRMKPMLDKGAVRDTGEKRKGESGRASVVWAAT